MIQANELRIGNLVYRNDMDGDFTYSVRSISKDKLHKINLIENDHANNCYYSCDCELEDIDPIPLTPEILEKCGFQQEGSEAGDDGAMELGCAPLEKDICFLWVPKVGRYTEEFALGFWVEQDYGKNSIQLNLDKIQYLHQLQNLYFALTGEELNFKP